MGDALYLVDGSGYIFRAYHALPPLTVRSGEYKGEPIGAVYGFAQMLIKLEQDHHPSHLAVVFDKAGKTSFREQLYEDYKANRAEAPDDLVPQFKRVREVTAAFGIPGVEVDAAEADDVIATLTRRARAAGMRVVIVSSDKDLMQLIDDEVRMVRPVWQSGPKGGARGGMQDVLYGADEVVARYGVPPKQLGDVLALMGDAVDNIPGVPGVGEKTAAALVQHFGSLENLLARLDEVPSVPKLRGAEKVRQALAGNVEQARMSRKLVALDCELPLDVELASLRRVEPDMAKVETLFRALDFWKLLERLQPQGGAAKGAEPELFDAVKSASQAQPSAAPITQEGAAGKSVVPLIVIGAMPVRIIETLDALVGLVEELRRAGEMGMALETTGGGLFAPLGGIAFAADGIAPSYLPLGHRYLGAPLQLEVGAAVGVLAPLLGDARVRKHIHGSKEAWLACLNAGLPLAGIVGDPDLAAYLLDPTRSDDRQRQKSLSLLAAEFGAVVEDREGVSGKGKNRSAVGYESLEIARAASYAAGRAEATLGVSRMLRPRIEARGFDKLLDEMELPLAQVLAMIERHGIKVDTSQLGTLGAEMARRMETIEDAVQKVAGYEVNLGSPKQLQDLLFGKLQLPATKKTKTGYSTDAEVLEELALLNPVADQILEHRGLAKLKGTYVDALPGLVNAKTGRLHTTYHQTVAGTGRLSSTDPNLQNIPIRSDVGKLIRRAFVADPGNVLIAADYSQIELRVLAHLSRDAVLLDAFTRGEDVHTRTAREVFGVEESAVTSEMRRVSKAINYGLVYGQTGFGLARAAGIGRDEAQRYITGYFARYTGVATYMERLIAEGHRDGGARTLLGRFRPIPELASKNRALRQAGERMARNTPIQGTAADLLKLAMIAVQARLERELPSVRMLLTVHDELVLEAPASDAERAGNAVKETMESVWSLAVPLLVEVGSGANWAEC